MPLVSCRYFSGFRRGDRTQRKSSMTDEVLAIKVLPFCRHVLSVRPLHGRSRAFCQSHQDMKHSVFISTLFTFSLRLQHSVQTHTAGLSQRLRAPSADASEILFPLPVWTGNPPISDPGATGKQNPMLVAHKWNAPFRYFSGEKRTRPFVRQRHSDSCTSTKFSGCRGNALVTMATF